MLYVKKSQKGTNRPTDKVGCRVRAEAVRSKNKKHKKGKV